MNLKAIYETYKEHIDAHPCKSNKKKKKKKQARDRQTESVITDAQISAIQSHYPTDHASPPVSLSTANEDKNEDTVEKTLQPIEMKSIESNLNEMMLDENRIVHPNAGLNELYEFVPATKLKGN